MIEFFLPATTVARGGGAGCNRGCFVETRLLKLHFAEFIRFMCLNKKLRSNTYH